MKTEIPHIKKEIEQLNERNKELRGEFLNKNSILLHTGEEELFNFVKDFIEKWEYFYIKEHLDMPEQYMKDFLPDKEQIFSIIRKMKQS